MDKETEAAFRKAFLASTKRLDMGKCCIGFKKPDDLPLYVIEKTFANIKPKDYIALCEKALKRE